MISDYQIIFISSLLVISSLIILFNHFEYKKLFKEIDKIKKQTIKIEDVKYCLKIESFKKLINCMEVIGYNKIKVFIPIDTFVQLNMKEGSIIAVLNNGDFYCSDFEKEDLENKNLENKNSEQVYTGLPNYYLSKKSTKVTKHYVN